MNEIFSFISHYIYVYIWVIFTTFINIIAPVSGSAVVTPVIAYATSPQRAVGIAAFLFFLSAIHRIHMFRKNILSEKKNIDIIKHLLPFSIVGAVAGGFFVAYVNTKVLAIIIVVVSLYYIFRTLVVLYKKNNEQKKTNKYGGIFIGILSGFMQGSGMSGGDIRANYLRSIVSEVNVRAVSSVVGLVNFFIAGSILFLHNKLTRFDIIFVISIFPFIILAQLYGKKFLDKMKDRNAKILAICLSIFGIVLLTYKYLL
ncbi:MAG: sulfite exporter TauE/SafE family protein [Candidatus Nomurabacteria bacterium]|nr:sulfite exporter TauE/SafE family protein [Candidatus Nomurabacteria bacterium]